jgi:membrane-associated protease RseP (regulator of RpoE activity)
MPRVALSPLARARPPALIAIGARSTSTTTPNRAILRRPSSSALFARLPARDGQVGRDGRDPTSRLLAKPPSAPTLRDAAENGDGDGGESSNGNAAAPTPTQQQQHLSAAPFASALALALALPSMGVQGFSLAGPWSTIQALGVLAAVIAVHEAGHFAAARSLGVLVSRFCIGFGPTLVAWRPGVEEADAREEEEARARAEAEAAAAAEAAAKAKAAKASGWPWQQQQQQAPGKTSSSDEPLSDMLALLDRLRASLPGGSSADEAAASTPPPTTTTAPQGPKPWPRGSVEYALCALPLGGYVAFPEPEDAAMRERAEQQQQKEQEQGGEDGTRRPEPYYAPDDPDLLANRPVPQRLLVASAGVAFNCAFAFLTLLAQMLIVGKAEYDYLPGVRVPDVTRGGAAELAGLKKGDTLVRVGSAQLGTGPGQVAAAVAQIKASTPGEPLELVVLVEDDGASGQLPSAPPLKAEGEGAVAPPRVLRTKTLLVTPVAGPRPPPAKTPEEAMAQPPPSSQIGVSLIANTFVRHTKPDSLPEAARVAASEFSRLGGSVLSGLRSILTDFRAASQQLSGPVAIVAAGSEIARADAAGLYQFCAVVNINLAAVNALPLPGLDGGFAALLMVEAARGGKKVSKGVEAGVMAGGLALLTLMGVALVVRDTARLLL